MSKQAYLGIGKAFLLSAVLTAAPAMMLRWLVL
jgi:hypothetical protein